jgi:hypothetical protein
MEKPEIGQNTEGEVSNFDLQGHLLMEQALLIVTKEYERM